MARKRRLKDSTKRKAFQEVVHPNAAGIDIGAEQSWVAVPPDRDEEPVRAFGCFTEDLHALAKWLEECGVETVAMESTGVYWVPIYQVLEEHGFEVCLVNARHVKNVPGRKTDVLDCQWLQQLHAFGLLAASFRPSDEIAVLRSYWRHRDNLVRYASSHIKHMQKALDQMNIQLHKVISDITGVTGLRIIDAVLDGERDRLKLAALRDYRVKSDEERIAKALEGDYRQEHLFALRQALESYRFYQQQIDRCDREIESYLNTLENRVDTDQAPLPPARRKKRSSNQPSFDLRNHLYRISGVDFTQIEGFGVMTVQTLLSEVGLDPTKFPNQSNFCSWLTLCPEPRITGGHVKSTGTRKSSNRAAAALRIAAQSLAHSSGPLGGFYRQMRARLGPQKAITATAHKLARLFYHLWTTHEPYDPNTIERDNHNRVQKQINSLRKKARALGFELLPQPVATQ